MNKLYTTLIVLMPILNIYSAGISSIGIGDVIGIVTLVLLLIANEGKLGTRERKYGCFVLFSFAISFILSIVISEYSLWQFALKGLRFAVYSILIICFGRETFDVEYGFSLYIKVSVIAACYLIIQYIFKTFLSISLPITIPYLKLLYSDVSGASYNAELLKMYSIFGYRAPGFFREPSHFCQYVILSVALMLFKSARDKKMYLSLIIIVAAIILSYSAIGYISLMATIVIWFVYTFKERKIGNNIIMMLLGTVMLTVLSIKTGAMSSAISRIQTIKYTHAATGNLRLLRGFYVYKEVPAVFKIIGIGFGNYSAFIDRYSITTFFDDLIDHHSEYMSAISCVLLNSGIIGEGLYIAALADVFKRAELVQKVMFVSFVILIIATSSFFSATYVMYMVFLIAKIDKNDNIADVYAEAK